MQLFVSETLRKGLVRNGEKKGVEEKLVRIVVEDGSGRGKKRQLVDYECLVRQGCKAWRDACQVVLFVALSQWSVTRATVPAKHCSPKPDMKRSASEAVPSCRQSFRDSDLPRGSRCITAIAILSLLILSFALSTEEKRGRS